MIYGSNLPHVDYMTLMYVRNQNITILKLTPHTTDLLQPQTCLCLRTSQALTK